MSTNRPAPAPRLVHIGLGNFHRAHQIPFTADAPNPDGPWTWAAFAGRGGGAIDRLGGNGAFDLLIRGPGSDGIVHHDSIARLHRGDDRAALDALLAAPTTVAMTLTITEAGYRATGQGRARMDDPDMAADIEVLTAEATSRSLSGRGRLITAPARILSGLAARSGSGAGPLALVPCDNVPSNAAVLRGVLTDLAERVDAASGTTGRGGLVAWMEESLRVVGTVVDRITPRTMPADAAHVTEMTGAADPVVVVTEPFREWVIDGAVEGGPDWAAAGAIIADDLIPYEMRKLHLLNGAHSILAYVGLGSGHETVDAAIGDERCRSLVEDWWDLCTPSLRGAGADAVDLDAYRSALLERFSNPRLPHRLAQIAIDGSEKLPIRVLPILRREREAGRLPDAPLAVLGAWVRHVRDAVDRGGAPDDARAADLAAAADGEVTGAAARLLGLIDPDLGDDAEVVAAVAELAAGSGG